MRYNLNFGKSFKKTTKGLDGIIEALTYPPPNPKTVVTYKNGNVIEYLIEGELGSESVPDRENTIKVDIGTAVTSIGDEAFLNCSELMSIAIPNSVTNIGMTAFSGSGLTSVTIPASVTSIDVAAFSYCYKLTSIMIPDGITCINGYAFEGCTSLTSFTIPNSVTSIEYMAFEECSSLTSITIPNSVINISDKVFLNCTNLSSITCLATTAPTIQSNTFGYSESTYTGRNTYSSGSNVLKVPQGATGYDSSYWLDPLQDATKCGFHIEYE